MLTPRDLRRLPDILFGAALLSPLYVGAGVVWVIHFLSHVGG